MNVKYGYGLQTIESRSMFDRERTYTTPKFYHAYSSKNIGVYESHGMTYIETRNEYKKLGHVMGLEKRLNGKI